MFKMNKVAAGLKQIQRVTIYRRDNECHCWLWILILLIIHHNCQFPPPVPWEQRVAGGRFSRLLNSGGEDGMGLDK